MAGILICDDNPNIRYLLRVFVESQTPFNICGEAGHGTEAIEKAKKLQPDLILLDLSMPVMTGAEAASVLKAMLPRTKITLFSMHIDNVPRSLAAAAVVSVLRRKQFDDRLRSRQTSGHGFSSHGERTRCSQVRSGTEANLRCVFEWRD